MPEQPRRDEADAVNPAVDPAVVDPAEVERAMATYSADGQVDDETGNDAGAEQLRDESGPLNDEGLPHGPN